MNTENKKNKEKVKGSSCPFSFLKKKLKTYKKLLGYFFKSGMWEKKITNVKDSIEKNI